MSRKDADRWLNCAAVYVRMSTEHQQYSTSNQMDAIREYAKQRGQESVKDYSDEGKSGLNIQGRDSLAQMIRDVEEGRAEYSNILVYDVSRRGRFQDSDESAYDEYICRKAGVAVHYCAGQFENDGSPMSNVMKTMKRTMAGEYSQELSTKVFQGACRLIQLGYKQGGTAGFGLRRMLNDQSGARKATLKLNGQKSIQTDRVVLVRGSVHQGPQQAQRPAPQQTPKRLNFSLGEAPHCQVAEWQTRRISSNVERTQIRNLCYRRTRA